MTPSSEDFDRWREDFVTRWIFKALEKASEAQRDQWLGASWQSGITNPVLERQLFNQMRELRTRADAWDGVRTLDYLAWCSWNGDEPNES